MAECQEYLGFRRQSFRPQHGKTDCYLGFDEEILSDARISTYATISDFKQKSVEDIKKIKAHGLDES